MSYFDPIGEQAKAAEAAAQDEVGEGEKWDIGCTEDKMRYWMDAPKV